MRSGRRSICWLSGYHPRVKRSHLARRLLKHVPSVFSVAAVAPLFFGAGFQATSSLGTVPITSQSQATSLIKAGLVTSSVTNVREMLAADIWPNYGPCAMLAITPISQWPGPSGCTFGEKSASKTVLLVGDSRAQILLGAFNALGATNGFGVVPMILAGCTFTQAATMPRPCQGFASWVGQEIATLHPSAVLVAGKFVGPTSPTSLATKGLVDVLSGWSKLGSPVVLLGNTPVIPTDPKQCISVHPTTLTKCGFDLKKSEATWLNLKGAAAAAHVAYAPIIQVLCTTKCPIVVDGIAAYLNTQHASPQLLEAMAEPIGEALKGSLPGLIH